MKCAPPPANFASSAVTLPHLNNHWGRKLSLSWTKRKKASVFASLLLTSLFTYLVTSFFSSSCTPDPPFLRSCRPSSAADAVPAARRVAAARATTAPSACFPCPPAFWQLHPSKLPAL